MERKKVPGKESDVGRGIGSLQEREGEEEGRRAKEGGRSEPGDSDLALRWDR